MIVSNSANNFNDTQVIKTEFVCNGQTGRAQKDRPKGGTEARGRENKNEATCVWKKGKGKKEGKCEKVRRCAVSCRMFGSIQIGK